MTFKFGFDIFYLGLWRAYLAPFYDILDAGLVALKDCLYAPIRQVAHPSSDSM